MIKTSPPPNNPLALRQNNYRHGDSSVHFSSRSRIYQWESDIRCWYLPGSSRLAVLGYIYIYICIKAKERPRGQMYLVVVECVLVLPFRLILYPTQSVPWCHHHHYKKKTTA